MFCGPTSLRSIDWHLREESNTDGEGVEKGRGDSRNAFDRIDDVGLQEECLQPTEVNMGNFL